MYEEYKELVEEHNCAVANGLVMRARQLDKILTALDNRYEAHNV